MVEVQGLNCTSCCQYWKHCVAQDIEKDEGHCNVKFLNHTNNKFHFPPVDDISIILRLLGMFQKNVQIRDILNLILISEYNLG